MSGIPQKYINENEVSDFATKFISRFHISEDTVCLLSDGRMEILLFR